MASVFGRLVASEDPIENSVGAVNDCGVLELNQPFLWPQLSEFGDDLHKYGDWKDLDWVKAMIFIEFPCLTG